MKPVSGHSTAGGWESFHGVSLKAELAVCVTTASGANPQRQNALAAAAMGGRGGHIRTLRSWRRLSTEGDIPVPLLRSVECLYSKL